MIVVRADKNIILKPSGLLCSVRQSQYTFAMAFAMFKISLIAAAVSVFPYTFSMRNTVLIKIPSIHTAVAIVFFSFTHDHSVII